MRSMVEGNSGLKGQGRLLPGTPLRQRYALPPRLAGEDWALRSACGKAWGQRYRNRVGGDKHGDACPQIDLRESDDPQFVPIVPIAVDNGEPARDSRALADPGTVKLLAKSGDPNKPRFPAAY